MLKFYCMLIQTQDFAAGTKRVSNNVSMNELIPWSRVLLEKLTVPELEEKFPHFMEPEGHYHISQSENYFLSDVIQFEMWGSCSNGYEYYCLACDAK
jgi:hypothetical protein